jgi:NTE family protein
MNRLLDEVPPAEREGMRLVEILVLRPSSDLGKLAGQFEPRLPKAFRYLTRGLGTRQTASPDILSLLMFQVDYLRALVELGERDVEANKDRIDGFLSRSPAL